MLRENFPKQGEEYLGETSPDGWQYQIIFRGRTLSDAYQMVRNFLEEEGYEDIPLPKDAEELALFRLKTRNKQVLLFEDNGYVHNPVKILFPLDRRKKTTLILNIFNENTPNHLVKFHRIEEKRGLI